MVCWATCCQRGSGLELTPEREDVAENQAERPIGPSPDEESKECCVGCWRSSSRHPKIRRCKYKRTRLKARGVSTTSSPVYMRPSIAERIVVASRAAGQSGGRQGLRQGRHSLTRAGPATLTLTVRRAVCGNHQRPIAGFALCRDSSGAGSWSWAAGKEGKQEKQGKQSKENGATQPCLSEISVLAQESTAAHSGPPSGFSISLPAATAQRLCALEFVSWIQTAAEMGAEHGDV